MQSERLYNRKGYTRLMPRSALVERISLHQRWLQFSLPSRVSNLLDPLDTSSGSHHALSSDDCSHAVPAEFSIRLDVVCLQVDGLLPVRIGLSKRKESLR